MEAYGAGELSEAVGILLPVPRPDAYSDGSGLKNETENTRGTWEMCGGRAALDVDPDSILAWGVTWRSFCTDYSPMKNSRRR